LTVTQCLLCGKGPLVKISYDSVPLMGLVALRANPGSTTEVRRVPVTCPNGKGIFTLNVTVQEDADPISVDSVTNI